MITLFFCLAALSTAEAATREDRAEHLAEKAQEAFQKNQFTEAFRFANKALKLNPDNPTALDVRGSLLYRVGALTTGEERNQLWNGAFRDLAHLVEVEPDSLRSGIARDTLAALSPTPFPRPAAATCSPESEASLAKAEQLYNLGHYDEARPYYEAALKGCPSNAEWWVYYGDIFFQSGNFVGARQQYGKALAIEPCNWMAHRFMADAWEHEGKAQESYESALRSVACNPTYSAGQEYLKSLVTARTVAVGTRMETPSGQPAGHHWVVAPALAEQSKRGPVWQLVATEREKAAADKSLSAFEVEKRALSSGLVLWRQMKDSDAFWNLLSAAESDGHLDAAIYLLTMNPGLYTDFVVWRDGHLSELVGFLGGYLEVAPGLQAK